MSHDIGSSNFDRVLTTLRKGQRQHPLRHTIGCGLANRILKFCSFLDCVTNAIDRIPNDINLEPKQQTGNFFLVSVKNNRVYFVGSCDIIYTLRTNRNVLLIMHTEKKHHNEAARISDLLCSRYNFDEVRSKF